MKKFISTREAVDHCNDSDCIIPSAFLSVFPNNFGINLCAVKGFEVELDEYGQYVSIKTVFIPAPAEDLQLDHTWALDSLNKLGNEYGN